MNLRPHQARFLAENPDRAMLVWECRVGKSLPAKIWSERRGPNAIIVCLKSNKKEWQELCPHADIYTKEEFKKHYHGITNPTCLVWDEAHFAASPLFIAKKRSQIAEATYQFIKTHQIPVLLLTATPLTNDPASLHTLLTYIGHYIDWKTYREHFYTLEVRPYLPRPAWLPKAGWRKEANKLIEKYCDIVSLKDCVDYLPPLTEENISIQHTPHPDPEHWVEAHMAEQTKKADYIKTLGYRKLIVVCTYTAQIDDLKKKLEKDKPVYVLDGRTKDQGHTIKDAQEDTDCYLLVQAKMGMGWDGYMFPAMVFASLDHRVLDLVQMKGRLTSIDNPSPHHIYYLLGGVWDRRIYTAVVKNGVDFDIHTYGATATAKEI